MKRLLLPLWGWGWVNGSSGGETEGLPLSVVFGLNSGLKQADLVLCSQSTLQA